MEILLIVVFSILNGVFAMSEAAVISARKSRLQQLADDGDMGAKAALELAQNPNRFLSSVQIGITLIGILSGAVGGATISHQISVQVARVPLLAPYSEAVGVFAVVLLITYLSLVFGELVPKRMALLNAERIAARVAPPMNTISRVAAPIINLLSFSTEGVLRLLGVRASNEPSVTAEDVEAMVKEGAQSGIFEASATHIVSKALRLDDQTLGHAMTPRTEMVWLDIDEPIEAIHDKIIAHPNDIYPVVRGDIDNVVGFAHACDLLRGSLRGKPLNLAEIMREPVFLTENTTLGRGLEQMQRCGEDLALVISEDGGIEGAVTLHSLMEKVVGNLERSAVNRGADGVWTFEGLMSISEVRAKLQIDTPFPGEEDEHFRSLGGFVMSHLGRVPRVSDHFTWEGWRFHITEMDHKRVAKVQVSHHTPETSA
jgi:putative hemolysin